MPVMTVPEFVAKWAASQQTQHAVAQEDFIDLCNLLGHLTSNTGATGESFASERVARGKRHRSAEADRFTRGDHGVTGGCGRGSGRCFVTWPCRSDTFT
jgi:hypothetical protein